MSMLHQVWGKNYIYQFWCQNMVGKFGAYVDWGGTSGRAILNQMCAYPLDGGPKWDWWGCGMGYHCRWRASISWSTTLQMCGSWHFPIPHPHQSSTWALIRGAICTSSGKYGPPRGASPTSTLAPNFPSYFGTTIGKFNFPLIPEEAL